MQKVGNDLKNLDYKSGRDFDSHASELCKNQIVKKNSKKAMTFAMTLVEKATAELDEKEMKKSVNKMMGGKFDLNDMMDQMRQVQKLGSLGGLMKLIPGMPKVSPEQLAAAEKQMKQFEVIINSMTPEERHNPEILKFSRKNRIARGSGTNLAQINQVLKKYETMKEAMKQMESYRKSGRVPPGGLGGLGGFGGF